MLLINTNEHLRTFTYKYSKVIVYEHYQESDSKQCLTRITLCITVSLNLMKAE